MKYQYLLGKYSSQQVHLHIGSVQLPHLVSFSTLRLFPLETAIHTNRFRCGFGSNSVQLVVNLTNNISRRSFSPPRLLPAPEKTIGNSAEEEHEEKPVSVRFRFGLSFDFSLILIGFSFLFFPFRFQVLAFTFRDSVCL